MLWFYTYYYELPSLFFKNAELSFSDLQVTVSVHTTLGGSTTLPNLLYPNTSAAIHTSKCAIAILLRIELHFYFITKQTPHRSFFLYGNIWILGSEDDTCYSAYSLSESSFFHNSSFYGIGLECFVHTIWCLGSHSICMNICKRILSWQYLILVHQFMNLVRCIKVNMLRKSPFHFYPRKNKI